MIWTLTTCGDRAAIRFARRHYSCRRAAGTPDALKVGSNGRHVVLRAGDPIRALWITTWQDAAVTDHAWPGAWNCALFRNEGPGSRPSSSAKLSRLPGGYGPPFPPSG